MRLPECCRRLDTKSGGNRDHLGQSMAQREHAQRRRAQRVVGSDSGSACGRVGMCSSPHAAGDATAMTPADVDDIVRNQADERRAGQHRRPAIAPANTNRARHQRGSPRMRRIADMVGLKFAHDPKEIAVEPRILGTRLRITRSYRSPHRLVLAAPVELGHRGPVHQLVDERHATHAGGAVDPCRSEPPHAGGCHLVSVANQ
jgi:hypothetical protein